MLTALAAPAAVPPASGIAQANAAPEPIPAAAAAAPGTSGTPNPRLRLDGELGMVVIEFRSRTGEVSSSFPTPREMDAYRRSLQTAGQTGRDVLA